MHVILEKQLLSLAKRKTFIALYSLRNLILSDG